MALALPRMMAPIVVSSYRQWLPRRTQDEDEAEEQEDAIWNDDQAVPVPIEELTEGDNPSAVNNKDGMD